MKIHLRINIHSGREREREREIDREREREAIIPLYRYTWHAITQLICPEPSNVPR